MKKLFGAIIFFFLMGGMAVAIDCSQFIDTPDYEICMNSNALDGSCSDGNCIDCLTADEKKQCKYDNCLGGCEDSNPGPDGADYCDCKCNGGVTLNTSVPFIGRCILLGSSNASGPNSTEVTQLSAFPRLMKALTNIALSLILVTSLIMIIAGGVMIASSGANSGGYDQGKKMIRKVVLGLILLGASGIILALINPNFFG